MSPAIDGGHVPLPSRRSIRACERNSKNRRMSPQCGRRTRKAPYQHCGHHADAQTGMVDEGTQYRAGNGTGDEEEKNDIGRAAATLGSCDGDCRRARSRIGHDDAPPMPVEPTLVAPQRHTPVGALAFSITHRAPHSAPRCFMDKLIHIDAHVHTVDTAGKAPSPSIPSDRGISVALHDQGPSNQLTQRPVRPSYIGKQRQVCFPQAPNSMGWSLSPH